MNSNLLSKTARFAGLLYLIWILLSLFGMFYVSSKINMKGDPASVARNILSNEFLFRISILTDILTSTVWLFLILLLYKLFKPVNEHQARVMTGLVIVQVPVVFVMEALNIASLKIFHGELLQSLEINQRLDIALMLHKMNGYGLVTQELFWGLWLFPLAVLIYRSHFLPRFLA
jgi:hypothetical protein